MRGKELPVLVPVNLCGITPAYAGKSTSAPPAPEMRWDHPRVCGEKPKKRAERVEPLGITPAYAGKRNQPRTLPGCSWDHPRVCGEKLKDLTTIASIQGSPPRMRGKETAGFFLTVCQRITPAYAGKRPPGRWHWGSCRDHPRVCGEKFIAAPFTSGVLGSPPRMRGKVCVHSEKFVQHGITPAYAGKSTDA